MEVAGDSCGDAGVAELGDGPQHVVVVDGSFGQEGVGGGDETPSVAQDGGSVGSEEQVLLGVQVGVQVPQVLLSAGVPGDPVPSWATRWSPTGVPRSWVMRLESSTPIRSRRACSCWATPSWR